MGIMKRIAEMPRGKYKNELMLAFNLEKSKDNKKGRKKKTELNTLNFYENIE